MVAERLIDFLITSLYIILELLMVKLADGFSFTLYIYPTPYDI